MKKIAFLISDQHLIPHGGIGSFCKSFCQMQEEFGNSVDIVVDKKPNNSFVYSFTTDNIQVKYNTDPLSYSQHTNIFMYGESVNFEKIVNFQKIIGKLLEDYQYDYIVANSHESYAAIASFKTKGKIVLYTHLYKQIFPNTLIKDVFLPSYHKFFEQFLHFPNIVVGTQSEYNKQNLLKQNIPNVEVLPMPISDKNLLSKSEITKEGVLFVGRWEKGKNPETYIKVMSQLKLPCKVMTNKNGKKKFIQEFKKAGITNYTIAEGIIGKEKVDFIKGCKVFFCTSLAENYSFAVYETIGHMPVIVLDNQEWSNNFDSNMIIKTNVKNATDKVLECYNNDNYDNLSYVQHLDNLARNVWYNFI